MDEGVKVPDSSSGSARRTRAHDDEAEGRVEGRCWRGRGARSETIGQDEHDLAARGRAGGGQPARHETDGARQVVGGAEDHRVAAGVADLAEHELAAQRAGPEPGQPGGDEGVELVHPLGCRQPVGADDDGALTGRQRGDGCREGALGRHRRDGRRDDGERGGEAECSGDGEPAEPGMPRAGGEQGGEHTHAQHLLRAGAVGPAVV